MVKPSKKDSLDIRLMKNFDQELDDIVLAKEGYNLQEIGILQRARNVMKKEGQNPDDALAWVRSEMADDAGVDFEEFMKHFPTVLNMIQFNKNMNNKYAEVMGDEIKN